MRRTLLTIVLSIALCSLASWLLSKPAYAELIPALKVISAGFPSDVRDSLTKRKAELEKELKDFQAAAKVFNDKTAEQQTDEEYNALQAQRADYIIGVRVFNEEVVNSAPKPGVDPERARIIKSMNALAKQLGWSMEKQARLDKALNSLGVDGDPEENNDLISRTWQDVLARDDKNTDLVRDASQGRNSGIPWGIKQKNDDCAIYALATAVGELPYKIVERAVELIRHGEWRNDYERSNPQKRVIEGDGLMGGEVVLLAESFGQVEVIPSSDFAKTLKEGRPVLVNVTGGSNSAHEVVLTKTFQHGGETWYVMMDSSQSEPGQLFLSAKELHMLLRENGVAFRPEP